MEELPYVANYFIRYSHLNAQLKVVNGTVYVLVVPHSLLHVGSPVCNNNMASLSFNPKFDARLVEAIKYVDSSMFRGKVNRRQDEVVFRKALVQPMS